MPLFKNTREGTVQREHERISVLMINRNRREQEKKHVNVQGTIEAKRSMKGPPNIGEGTVEEGK